MYQGIHFRIIGVALDRDGEALLQLDNEWRKLIRFNW